MASETSELTFVRCPSCRSLVPASAVRCRICNNPLDSAGKDGAAKDGPPKETQMRGDDSEAAKNASRVRQKTMSASPDEIASALSDARAENAASASLFGASSAPPPEKKEPVVASSSQPPPVAPFAGKPAGDAVLDDADDIDPLGAYLEELDGPGDSGKEGASEPKKAFEVGGSSNLLGDPTADPLGLDLMDDLDDELSSEASSNASGSMAEPERAAPLWAVQPTEGMQSGAQRPIVQGPMGTPSASKHPSADAPVAEEPFAGAPAPQDVDLSPASEGVREPVGVSSQKQSEGKAPGANGERQERPPFGERGDASAPTRRALNFGAPVRPQHEERKVGAPSGGNQPQRPEPQRHPERGQEQRGGRDRNNGSQRDAGQQPGRREESRREESKRDEGRRDENRRDGGNRFEQRASQGQPQQPRPQDKPVTSGPKAGKSGVGKLLGWLVSYAQPEGRAIELREGKFFVTAGSMKGADLIIDDPSISTPHALMRVSGEKGLHVEDLMSECGVFVRAQDGAAYQREEDALLRHGDWVRFGDVEYVVTLAAPGPK